MKHPLFAKIIAVLAVISPLSAWSQEGGGLVPDRLGIGNSNRGGSDVKLTTEGQVLPGDLGSAIPAEFETPEETAEDEIARVVDQFPDSVMKLTKAQQIEISHLLREAATFIQGIRLQEGLDRLIQIEAMTRDFYQTYNLRGAIYTKLRDFDKARAAFQHALTLKDNLMEARFNLAELDFVEKKFLEAEAAFRLVVDDFPNLREDTTKLIDYKLFVSVLLQSASPGDFKEKQALAMLETFDYLDDYPVYYYAKAALAFHNGDEEEAEGWMGSASKIYDKPTQSIYVDALIEMGWVESL